MGGLLIGLAHSVRVTRPVASGRMVTWDDIEVVDSQAVRVRREMEAMARRASNR